VRLFYDRLGIKYRKVEERIIKKRNILIEIKEAVTQTTANKDGSILEVNVLFIFEKNKKEI
jgi:hypothetical protein